MAFAEDAFLNSLKEELNRDEKARLAPLATLSSEAIRRHPEQRSGHRQPFAHDVDRILHSKAYTRYIDKTQVFSLVKNDHITHRVLHVQLVSRIGRTIGRFLGLNEDLIEAIALGHDIGHPPFGHEGERILTKLCRKHGLDSFQHNIQSLQFLENFERKGRGWNLTLQTLDGILCHDGEVHRLRLRPERQKSFKILDREIARKSKKPMIMLSPMTLEGCVVRLADTISYIGRDIEDAIELGMITRADIPKPCAKRLGTSNGTIVYTLVTDLIKESIRVRNKASLPESEDDAIGLSFEVAELLLELKKFNYERIYRNPKLKPDFAKIHRCYENLFDFFLEQTKTKKCKESGEVALKFSENMTDEYVNAHSPAARVRDYLAGMTDDFFLNQARAIGSDVPRPQCRKY